MTGRRVHRGTAPAAAPPGYGAGLVTQVRADVLSGDTAVTGASLAQAVRASGRLLGAEGALRAVDRVRADLQGLGPLQPLLALPGLTDILVNGPEEVWTDTGQGLQRAGIRFGSDTEVQALASRLIAAGGRRLDDSCPCMDVQLGSYRVHAVLPPVSTGSTLLSIRLRSPRSFPLEALEAGGMLDGVSARVLRDIVAGRLNFLISGATGTGKTTLLSSLLSLSDPAERIVLIEDAAELDPAHPHVVGLQSRHTNVEGAGKVDLPDLVRQAMRMRPDRLIVGECRGAEVRELLAAMNTGHDGAGGTIHANSAATVPARLAALGALAGMSPRALAMQAAGALDAVVHLERSAEGRRVAGISVLTTSTEGGLLALPALSLSSGGMLRREGWERLVMRLEAKGRR
ncbi:TadA family conjugal transfer-associated ATPase [Arthrobacter sp. BL-252-APC-1A]|uniref:TadA family conjugal transfer-associated ATPase n=1 Tax=Arthrobacter sp. BL-252-APC-1A TaxID=2606622 RepID=UPI0012B26613|nr:TadA family conjugal transfer-associated ATPase [Arthrobacter sp. BL-252-APC-1A]MSR99583.1 TadA family conjugal transfer-associated ATPase [Arthrobacter sp. BL-252-APC-1A]